MTVQVGKVRTIVSTPYTGARLKAKVLRAKAPSMRSKGRLVANHRLQDRPGLGTPGFDHRASSGQGTIVISNSLIILLFRINLLL